MKEALFVLRDRAFIRQSLLVGLRFDSRDFSEPRSPSIEFGKEWGSAAVSLGDTRVLAVASFDLVEPRSIRGSEGILSINLEYSPVCARAPDSRRTGPWVEVNRCLDRLVRDSRFIDLEALCVVAGKQVWEVTVDLTVVCDDGNVMECASIAVIACLKHFRYPQTTMDGDRPVIHSPLARDPASLTFSHTPIYTTFSFFLEGKHCLMDPTEDEESGHDGKLMIAANTFGEVCGFQQAGLVPADSNLLRNCCQMACRRAKHVMAIMKLALEEDAKRRFKHEKVGFTAKSFKPSDAGVSLRRVAAVEVDRRSERSSPPPGASMEDGGDDIAESSSSDEEAVKVKEEPADYLNEWGLELIDEDDVKEVERLTAADRVEQVELGDDDEEMATSETERELKAAGGTTRKSSTKGQSKKQKMNSWFCDRW